MPRSIRAALIALAAALLCALAGAVAAQARDRATYRFGDDLPAVERQRIADGFELAQRALPDVAPFVVRAGDDVRPRGVGRRGPFEYDYVAQAGGNRVSIFTSGDAYRTSTPAEVAETMVHEYYHLVQEELMGRERPASDEQEPFVPLWLVEGSAEWVAVRVGAAHGLTKYDRARQLYVREVEDNPVPLERFNREDDEEDPDAPDPYEDDPYSVGFLATELLVARHGGEPALERFWVLVGAEADWRAVFRRAFGVSAARFTREFVRWQRAGYPPVEEKS
jgi:hypothetical protein